MDKRTIVCINANWIILTRLESWSIGEMRGGLGKIIQNREVHGAYERIYKEHIQVEEVGSGINGFLNYVYDGFQAFDDAWDGETYTVFIVYQLLFTLNPEKEKKAPFVDNFREITDSKVFMLSVPGTRKAKIGGDNVENFVINIPWKGRNVSVNFAEYNSGEEAMNFVVMHEILKK